MIGDATFPWRDIESGLSHGVAIHHGTLPGGAMVTHNLGDNAVHEVKLCGFEIDRVLHSKASYN